MSKFVDNHPLARDLPEYKSAIHELKSSNNHFSRLMEDYEAIDKQVVRIEQGVETSDKLELDSLKMKRVKQKDYLVNMLRDASQ